MAVVVTLEVRKIPGRNQTYVKARDLRELSPEVLNALRFDQEPGGVIEVQVDHTLPSGQFVRVREECYEVVARQYQSSSEVDSSLASQRTRDREQ